MRIPDLIVCLAPDDASDAAHVLMGLAALIDPDDPDGLPADLSVDERQAVMLTTAQLALLHRLARYTEIERDDVARELRRISATIRGQVR
jgi:hypothetical protein